MAQTLLKNFENICLVFMTQIAIAVSSSTQDDDTAIQRPFLTRDLVVFGYTTPITPVTVIIFTTSALILYSAFTKQSSATASHILLDDSSEKTEKKMLQWKKEINNDPQKFAQYAREHSTCPSGQNGGSLGKFNYGAMVPAFDKAVFSPKNEVGEVIGPVQTNFGYHLILIHERDEQRQLVVE